MVKYEKLYEAVKSILSEKRFKHTLGVVKRAEEYAVIYNIDVEEAKLAALAHDIAKEISKDESYKRLEEYGIELDEIEKQNFNLVHSKLGAAIAKEEYGMNDEMISAIKYHTTGRENMTMLEKIIYLADATEENRKYLFNDDELSLNELVELIKKDIDAGLRYTLKWNLQSILRKDFVIHLDSVRAYNYYSMRI